MNAEQVRAFVIAGHGNLEGVKTMLEAEPQLLNAAFEWRPGDFETALQGASHVGNAEIAEFLLARGAPISATTAAMLGRQSELEAMLDGYPDLIHENGAHGITLLTHAALSGDANLVSDLYARGATTGASMALNLATDCGYVKVVRFLLETAKPDLSWKNMKGKTALEIAREGNDAAIIGLLEGASA
jgi:uncharacterized protein